ncbi:Serine/threonine-protein phosphatase 6 regulatory subunit [Entamoeba marina]
MQSPIDIILGKDDCTLEKLLDDEEFSTEIRSNNDLISFLSDFEVLQRILQYTTQDFPNDVDENTAHKYQIICSSMFGDDPVKIVENIGANKELVTYLFEALLSGNNNRISSAGQVLMGLVHVEDSVVYDLFIENENIIEIIMNHMELAGLLETLLQLMKLEDNEKTGVIEWICERNFIENLFKTLMNNASIDTIGNISSFIHNVVLWKVSNAESPALQFVTLFNNNSLLPEFINHVFKSDDDYLVEQCFRIISNILACSTVLTYNDTETLPGIFQALLPHVKEIETIFNQRKVGSITNNLVYIVLSLVLSGFQKVYDILVTENVFESMINVFYGDHLCTVVRQTIQMTVSSIFNGNVTCLKKKLLNDGKLLHTIIEKDKEAVQIKNVKNIAPDYWLIAGQMMTNLYHIFEDRNEEDDDDDDDDDTKDDEIRDIIVSNNEFIDYVRDVVLAREAEQSQFFNKINRGDDTDDTSGYDNDDDDDDYEDDGVDDEIIPNA